MTIPGWLISIAVLLPNLAIVVAPPRDVPAPVQADARMVRVLETIERLGQLGCFLTPLFLTLSAETPAQFALLALAVLALAAYLGCWVRYLSRGRHFSLLFEPLWVVPLPMAITPVVYFAAVAAVAQSRILSVSVVLLAVGHLYMSALSLRAVKASGDAGDTAGVSPTAVSE